MRPETHLLSFMETLIIKSLHDLIPAAKDFVTITEGFRRFAFYGAMGSGKTTMIKAICKQLGALDTVTSPSFSLVNEYRTAGGLSLYHFDLYRITFIEELYDMGYEEYFFGDSNLLSNRLRKNRIPDPRFLHSGIHGRNRPTARLVKISLNPVSLSKKYLTISAFVLS
jgi:tRNA threonylcarbamoyladenosine biosynthesis protein TsaE